MINDLESTTQLAATPLNVTLVLPVKLLPKILTAAPTVPDVVWVLTKGAIPTEMLKTVPPPKAPSTDVVP